MERRGEGTILVVQHEWSEGEGKGGERGREGGGGANHRAPLSAVHLSTDGVEVREERGVDRRMYGLQHLVREENETVIKDP